MDLKQINDQALTKFIGQLKAAPEGSPIVAANQHLLGASVGASTWAGGGMLELAGFISVVGRGVWWTAECDVALTDFSSGVKAVSFSASGTGFMVGAIEGEVVGAFVVDPATIPSGDCHYTIGVGAVEEGAVTLFLYSTSGTLYGNFTGPSEGLAAGDMSGTGKLVVG